MIVYMSLGVIVNTVEFYPHTLLLMPVSSGSRYLARELKAAISHVEML